MHVDLSSSSQETLEYAHRPQITVLRTHVCAHGHRPRYSPKSLMISLPELRLLFFFNCIVVLNLHRCDFFYGVMIG